MPDMGDGHNPTGAAAPDGPKGRQFRLVESALVGAYFGLLLRPFGDLLSLWLQEPFAYGLTVFLMGLSIYPLGFRKNAPRAPWFREHAFLKWLLFCVAFGGVALILHRALPSD